MSSGLDQHWNMGYFLKVQFINIFNQIHAVKSPDVNFVCVHSIFSEKYNFVHTVPQTNLIIYCKKYFTIPLTFFWYMLPDFIIYTKYEMAENYLMVNIKFYDKF